MEVWILSHGYEYGDVYNKYKWEEETRFLGTYCTKKEAMEALLRYKKIRGFCSHLDGFYIGKYTLDKYSQWEGGYTTYYKKNEEKHIKSNNRKLYLLSHFYYTVGFQEKEKHRILGVYLSKLEAKRKIKKYQKIKGFSSHISNFYIEEFILDEYKEWYDRKTKRLKKI